MINIPPRMRVRSTPKKAGRNSHCVTHQGTKPASTNGAMTKNRAEPRTAIAFDIACSHDPTRIAWQIALCYEIERFTISCPGPRVHLAATGSRSAVAVARGLLPPRHDGQNSSSVIQKY